MTKEETQNQIPALYNIKHSVETLLAGSIQVPLKITFKTEGILTRGNGFCVLF